MSNNEAEQELEKFMDGYRKIYKYRQEFLHDHYLSIVKLDDNYIIQKNDSTTDIPDFNKELFIKLLVKEELVFQTSNIYVNCTELRTGGCVCGAWATQHPDHHSPMCRKYVK